MSLSTLKKSFISPVSRFYDFCRLSPTAVRPSSTTLLVCNSPSRKFSSISDARPFGDENDGGETWTQRRFWSKYAAVGLLFGSGLLLSPSFRRQLNSFLPLTLAADGTTGDPSSDDDRHVSGSSDEDDEDDAKTLLPEDARQTDQSLSHVTRASIENTLQENNQDSNANSNMMDPSDSVVPAETKKSRVGFRDRRIIEYENRIRAYSTPDKVFRYFASLQAKPEVDSNSEVFMTPEDFVRSLTPGAKQPEGLGLDKFLRIDPKKYKGQGQKSTLAEDSIFFKLAENGLLTFSDYLFLLTMLSTPPRHFEMAFKMFDFNGDGSVDCAEFEKVQNILRSRTTVGKRHRDHSNTGNVLKPIQPALTSYFFGKEKNEKLTVDKFIRFQKKLQEEILKIEFQRYDLNPDGKLREIDFADCILTHSGLSDKKMARMKRRVKKAFQPKEVEKEEDEEDDKDEDEEEKANADAKSRTSGVAFDEFVDFFSFLNNIQDVDVALTYYHVAGAAINKATFKHVAKTVASVRATDHVIDVIFVLFDEDQDEHLSYKEFISVMKQRGMRGLQKSRDTGFANLLTAMWKCGKTQAYDVSTKLVYGDYNYHKNNGRLRR